MVVNPFFAVSRRRSTSATTRRARTTRSAGARSSTSTASRRTCDARNAKGLYEPALRGRHGGEAREGPVAHEAAQVHVVRFPAERSRVQDLFLNLALSLGEAPPGKYNIKFMVRDLNSKKTADVAQDVVAQVALLSVRCDAPHPSRWRRSSRAGIAAGIALVSTSRLLVDENPHARQVRAFMEGRLRARPAHRDPSRVPRRPRAGHAALRLLQRSPRADHQPRRRAPAPAAGWAIVRRHEPADAPLRAAQVLFQPSLYPFLFLVYTEAWSLVAIAAMCWRPCASATSSPASRRRGDRDPAGRRRLGRLRVDARALKDSERATGRKARGCSCATGCAPGGRCCRRRGDGRGRQLGLRRSLSAAGATTPSPSTSRTSLSSSCAPGSRSCPTASPPGPACWSRCAIPGSSRRSPPASRSISSRGHRARLQPRRFFLRNEALYWITREPVLRAALFLPVAWPRSPCSPCRFRSGACGPAPLRRRRGSAPPAHRAALLRAAS